MYYVYYCIIWFRLKRGSHFLSHSIFVYPRSERERERERDREREGQGQRHRVIYIQRERGIERGREREGQRERGTGAET